MKISDSQNFLVSIELVKNIVNKAKFNTLLPVLEIGAGKGIITDELIGKGQSVYSFFPLLFLCLCQLRCLQQNTIDWVA